MRCREKFDVPLNAAWEKKVNDVWKKSQLTSREASAMGTLVQNLAGKNIMQSESKTIKKSAEKAHEWGLMAKPVQVAIDKAINLALKSA